MRVRPATAADYPGLARLQAGLPLFQRYGTTYEKALAAFSRPRPDDQHIWVAERDGALLGFIWFMDRGLFGLSGYVKSLAVAAEAQGMGAGAALLSAAEERAFSLGPNIFLLVSDFNQKAQAFYQRLGYQQVGALSGYILPDVAELLYRKSRGPIQQ